MMSIFQYHLLENLIAITRICILKLIIYSEVVYYMMDYQRGLMKIDDFLFYIKIKGSAFINFTFSPDFAPVFFYDFPNTG